MPGKDVKSLISGKRVYLSTPYGGEIPLTYHANGALDGEVTGMAQLLQKSDTGSWWMSGDRMCQKWHNWYKGKVYCFNLQKTDASSFEWLRDDGAKGHGRIAN